MVDSLGYNNVVKLHYKHPDSKLDEGLRIILGEGDIPFILDIVKHKAWDRNEPVENYVSKWYTVETYRQTYEQILSPLNGEDMWPQCSYEPILPPIDRRMPGRPKNARRKEMHEETSKKDGAPRLSKVGGKIHCSLCKSEGHIRKTCNQSLKMLLLKGQGMTIASTFHAQVPTHKANNKGKAKATATRPNKLPVKGKLLNDGPLKQKERVPQGIGLHVNIETGKSVWKPTAKKRKYTKAAGQPPSSTQESTNQVSSIVQNTNRPPVKKSKPNSRSQAPHGKIYSPPNRPVTRSNPAPKTRASAKPVKKWI